MATYLVIDSGVVVNAVVAESLEDAETATGKTCIEHTDANPAGIGWAYDGSKFTAPVSPAAEPTN